MHNLQNLKIKIFADGADLAGIVNYGRNPLIRGFTTNPTLMRKAGVSDYRAFAREVLQAGPRLSASGNDLSVLASLRLRVSAREPGCIVWA